MSYSILIPENIDLDHRIKNNPPDFDFNMDFVYYFISMIIVATSLELEMMKRKKSINWKSFCKNFNLKDFFIDFYSDDLKPLHRLYNKHIDYLLADFENDGKILWREPYTDTKPFSYQLAPEYFNQRLKLHLITDEKLLEEIEKINPKKRIIINDDISKNYKFLVQYFDAERLVIDFDDAKQYIESQYQLDRFLLKYKVNMVKIQNLVNENYKLSLKLKKDGRFHSNITSFPKELRHFLSYDDSVMGEVDIHASGFFFLYFLLKANEKCNLSDYLKVKNKTIYELFIRIKNESKVSETEIQEFGDLVLNGKLYDFFIDEFSKHFDAEYFKKHFNILFDEEFIGEREQIKEVVKKKLLALLYAKPTQFKEEMEVFKSVFPTIYEFIRKFKGMQYKGYEKREWHKKMAHLGMQTESYFMLHIIARTLNKTKLGSEHKRKIPFLTLHDCLVVKKEDMELVKQFMTETFVKEMGFAPVLKDKVWELN